MNYNHSHTLKPPQNKSTIHRMWQQIGAVFQAQPIEATLTAVTLLTLIVGYAAEQNSALIMSSIAYTIAYIAGGKSGLEASLASLRQRQIDIDLLMILAAIGAAIVGEPFEGALLLFLFSLSNLLQEYALDRTKHAIQSLMALRPSQAVVQRGQSLQRLPIEQIALNEHIIVRPGERIALDGIVVAGTAEVNQASITGESLPVLKSVGSKVLAGTLNENGHLEITVTHLAKDSTIAKLIEMVEEARNQKAKTQRFLETAEQYYAIGVILVTILTVVTPILFFSSAFAPAFYRAMTLMVAASPCALIISTPASILSAIGNGARNGVLFKGGAHVEQAATIKVIAFDKTGTLTIGKPQLTELIPLDTWRGTQAELLALAAAIEAKSEHILAQAVVTKAQEENLPLAPVSHFRAAAGNGVEAIMNGETIRIGTLRYLAEITLSNLPQAQQILDQLEAQGQTAVVIARIHNKSHQGDIFGIISFADTLRPQAAPVIQKLKASGIKKVVMLTGDNERVAQAIAQQIGLDAVYANLLPDDKMAHLQQLEADYGPVAMIGDGINDAPALATASLGIAMGKGGTDVALETADVVLMADNLYAIPYLIDLSRKTRETLITNLTFAAIMIAIMIIAIFTIALPLPLAVIGHEGGTVLVSLNGLRLLLYKPS